MMAAMIDTKINAKRTDANSDTGRDQNAAAQQSIDISHING